MNLAQLAGRLEHIEPFHTMELAKRAAELEKQGRELIHMGIGEPDFTAPPLVVEAASRAMAEGRMQYTPATGLPALREAISAHYQSVYGLNMAPERIVITAGASGALLLACAALVEAGSEVLMPDPSYPCNRHFIAAFEGHAKLIPSGPAQRFQLSEEMVRENWGDATRGVVLASPSNPTGTSIDPQELYRIVASVREKGGFTLVDEIYQGLRYDMPAFSALSQGEDVIVVNSFSKYFHMTGWRLGWLVVPPALVPAVEKLAQNFFICASSIAQHAALACFLPESLAVYEARRREFQQRRDFLVPAMESLGFRIPVKPDGAFYVYADCTAFSDDADALTMSMMEQAGVVMVPGLDYGNFEARRYVRAAYTTSLPRLQSAMERLRNFLTPTLE